MTQPHIWLRAETKPQEQRTALPPTAATKLLEAGFTVTVENGAQNIFPINQYAASGCAIAPAGSWVDAPRHAFILGLKELPEADFTLMHRHIYFAHAYKGQTGAEAILQRFATGGGALYDLEYLTHEDGRRVAAFGYWAGFAGTALAIMAWLNKQAKTTTPLPALNSYSDKDSLLQELATKQASLPQRPTMLVMGAKGRSGTGAVDLGKKLGCRVIEWDIAETQKGGPFPEINEADIFVNCVFVDKDLPPFVTTDTLKAPTRHLSVIADVSCDPNSSYNPVPIYNEGTSFQEPCLEIIGDTAPLHLIAIDHLPSLLPRESSEDYCNQLLPHLLALTSPEYGVWGRAKEIFRQHTCHFKEAS